MAERTLSTRHSIIIRENHRELALLGIDSVEGVFACPGPVMVDHRGKRDVLRLEPPGGPTLFVKRIRHEHLKERFHAFLRHGQFRSTARREWENYLKLQDSPVLTAVPVAYGEVTGLLGRASFIVTQAAPGTSLDSLVANGLEPSRRRQLTIALARWVRKMHEAGISFPDLHAPHIFVEEHGEKLTFRLIDVSRVCCGLAPGRRRRARDLAALNISVPAAQASWRDRLRFLREYVRGNPRRLLPIILERTSLLAARGKFQRPLVPSA